MNLSPSSQMIQLAMLETIRALRSEVELEVDHLQSAQEESDTEEEEEEEDMAALYQRMNISRRMSLPANLPLLRQDDTHRRLQALQRATGAGFREDDDRQDDADEQQEEEEGVRRDFLMMAASPMYADPRPSDSDVGSRSMRRGPAGLPDVLSDSVSRSSSKANPLPDLLSPEAPLSVAADCPDSSVIYRHPPTSINNHHHQNLEQTSINSDQRVGPGRGWVGIAQGLNRLAGTTTIDKGFLDQRRKSCFVPKTTSTSSSSSRRRLTRRRSVAGTGWIENTRVMGDIGDNQGGIFRDICAIVGIFGFYMCVRKIESLLK